MAIIISSIIVVLVILTVFFLNISPQFGGTITKAQKENYSKFQNHQEGVFINQGGVKMNMDFSSFIKMMRGFLGPQPKTRPESDVNVLLVDSTQIANYNGPTRLIWFGHSTFLMQINSKNILIDPMFGDVPAPHPLLGQKRFSQKLPIEIEKLPLIDLVLFSHDHYDHLDYGSVQLLKNKVAMFYTPLGVGSHLREWGIPSKKVVEMNWWEESSYLGLQLKCTPAQHFSGRGLIDRGKTLWSGWVISSAKENVFFSGDSGYGQHFKEIGDKYGPFDFAMMECGQYNQLWKEIHMMPEEAAQAGLDVRAKKIMPIHWGAFKLAMHPWTEPVERITTKANVLGIPITVPKIGEPILLLDEELVIDTWWAEFN